MKRLRFAERDPKKILTYFLVGLIVVGIIGYSLFQARNLIRGPQLTLQYPRDGATLTEPLVTLKGVATNITFISLNNRQIFVDKNGEFIEQLLLSPGYNLWSIDVKDKFGRVVSKRIQLVYKED
jgi:hypothetical protein